MGGECGRCQPLGGLKRVLFDAARTAKVPRPTFSKALGRPGGAGGWAMASIALPQVVAALASMNPTVVERVSPPGGTFTML